MIPDKQWVERYRNRLRRYEHLRLDFLKTKTTELANKIVVDEIRSEMEKAGVHRKIWESVVVESVQVDSNTGSIKINIHAEYFSEDGFDVAQAREFGTRDHYIQPLRYSMSFDRLDPEIGDRYGLPKALSWIQNGVRRFSKGHWVSGLPRLNIIEKTIESKEVELRERIYEEYENWKREVLHS